MVEGSDKDARLTVIHCRFATRKVEFMIELVRVNMSKAVLRLFSFLTGFLLNINAAPSSSGFFRDVMEYLNSEE